MKNNFKKLSNFFRKNSIQKRWLLNNLGVVAALLVIVEVISIILIHSSCYDRAKKAISSKLACVTGALSLCSPEKSAIEAELSGIARSFSGRDEMELQVIDDNGDIFLTSSGFEPSDTPDMPDYREAMESANGEASWTGDNADGEKVMAVTLTVSLPGGDVSAVRAVASLSNVDSTILKYAAIVTLVCAAILLVIAMTGMLFMNSIAKPVQQISRTAGKFAKGDFSLRIINHSNDEIGELCTAINHMADELQNADAMKNEFISSVSHELRTPLTAIRGWAETISAERDAVVIRKGIRVISNETERLSQMVEELLDFSRMQSGHFSLQFDTMDILAELGEAVLIYAERAKIEDITMTYEEPEMLPFVYGDKNRLRQVFINIIDNAIKYSNKGGTVKIVAGETPSGDIMVTVKDNGCGISDVDMPHVKTKFYKANNTKKGSGIGLAVADEIIALHGGTLSLESEAGKGTTVTITIPPRKATQ